MARSNNYDELDEMLVPQDHNDELQDEVNVPEQKGSKKPKQQKDGKKKTPYQLEKEEKKKKETRQTLVIVAVCFVLLLLALIGIGIMMSERAGVTSDNMDGTVTVQKAERAPDKTYFKSDLQPELSAEGVKGRLKEVYYAVDGSLAVTLRLSNGMAAEQELVKVGIRIFNQDDETVAQHTIDTFKPACRIKAGGYADYYLEIPKGYVSLTDDPLKQLGVTLEIGSKATSGNNPNKPDTGDGPKDIAPGRSYYENLGNRPELSTEGVKASVVRARYTNDGSLAVSLCLSNGTGTKQQVSRVDLMLANGEGGTIANYTFDSFETPCVVEAGAFTEYEVIVDKAYVSIQDDSLKELASTINVSAAGVA